MAFWKTDAKRGRNCDWISISSSLPRILTNETQFYSELMSTNLHSPNKLLQLCDIGLWGSNAKLIILLLDWMKTHHFWACANCIFGNIYWHTQGVLNPRALVICIKSMSSVDMRLQWNGSIAIHMIYRENHSQQLYVAWIPTIIPKSILAAVTSADTNRSVLAQLERPKPSNSRDDELPGHTTPGWYRYTRATILLVRWSCCHSLLGHLWTGPLDSGLRVHRQTWSCPYFSPKCPLLLPCFHLPLRLEEVRSGLPHTQEDIHRVQPASLLHMTGHPSYAGQPYGSLHNILGTCSSGGVCACWPCRLGWHWAERRGTLSLLPRQISHNTQWSAERLLMPTQITLIRNIYRFSLCHRILPPSLVLWNVKNINIYAERDGKQQQENNFF